jgi:hypothetical protein
MIGSGPSVEKDIIGMIKKVTGMYVIFYLVYMVR